MSPGFGLLQALLEEGGEVLVQLRLSGPGFVE